MVCVVDDDNIEYNDDINLEYLDCILSIQDRAVGPNDNNQSVGELTWMKQAGTKVSMEIFKTHKGYKQSGAVTI